MHTTPIREAADRLLRAADAATPCEPVRELIGAGDVDAAYRVQRRLVQEGLLRGRRLVGRKIGLTSLEVQKQLAVSQPDYGALFADMGRPQGLPIGTSSLIQPRIEAEIAFVLKDDLDEAELTTADLLRAIDFAVPALEIVCSRIRDWDISIADTIADNASSGLFVLGDTPRPLSAVDVVECGMTLTRQRLDAEPEVVSRGRGSACLGSPITAAHWLARVMATQGEPLRRGDVVLSGALGPMVPVVAGESFTASISGLGTVTARFSEE